MMAHILTGDDTITMSVKFLLKDIPDKLSVSESQIRMALRQKKYVAKWILLNFMDSNTALVSVRVPRKSKNIDFTINVQGHTVKAIKLSSGGYYRGGGETHRSNSVQYIRDLIRQVKTFTDPILIPRARVPVLKVKHRTTGIQCDISTLNGIGVENTNLLRNYMSDSRVRFVATGVKVWARQLGLTQAGVGPGSITSYCMLWLVIFALMQDCPPAAPSVVAVKQSCKGSNLFIDGWDCSFCNSPVPKLKNNKSEIELLIHFFSFYGSMTIPDITSNVISPFLGKMIPVKEFVKTNSLPNEFENYKKQARSDRFYEMRCDSAMCVQDPVEQGHNIAKTVEDWVVDRFLKLCKTTTTLVENSMSPHV
uniref:Poly(A) RNA polymerase mitochondrial-like central palm domain-containing protein n=2 Tax=Homalodisca TaxID=139475 RepID=A0A1B6JNG7_9HEMI